MQLQGLPGYDYEAAFNALADKMVAAGLDHNELQTVVELAQQEEKHSLLQFLDAVAAWFETKGRKNEALILTTISAKLQEW